MASGIGKNDNAFNDFVITSKICDVEITGRVDFQAYLDMNEDYYTNEAVAAAHKWMDNTTEEEFMAAVRKEDWVTPQEFAEVMHEAKRRFYSFSPN